MSGNDFEGKIICGVPDNVGSVDCLWPFRDVEVYAEGAIGSLFLADAVEWALAQWNAVCGIRLRMSANRKTAHVLCKPGHLDGPSNVLAQCELPCGFSPHSWRQLNMTCDLSEALVLAENPPAGKIDAGRMVCHELGHGLGVGHIASGNLMAPTYSNSIRAPRNGDVVEVRARYGLPAAPTPVPAPGPSAPSNPSPSSPFNVPTEISFTIGGVVYRYTKANG